MTALIIIAVVVLAALWGFDRFERKRYAATLSEADRARLATFEIIDNWRRFREIEKERSRWSKRGPGRDGAKPSPPATPDDLKGRILVALMALTVLLGAIVVIAGSVVALVQIAIWLLGEP